jgi:hypothetical protein
MNIKRSCEGECEGQIFSTNHIHRAKINNNNRNWCWFLQNLFVSWVNRKGGYLQTLPGVFPDIFWYFLIFLTNVFPGVLLRNVYYIICYMEKLFKKSFQKNESFCYILKLPFLIFDPRAATVLIPRVNMTPRYRDLFAAG